MDQKRLWSAVLAALAMAVAPAMAQEEAPPAEEPDELVEEVIVVTASRTEQSLNEAPAAISVSDGQGHRVDTGGQLRRAAAQRPGPQRLADQRPRLQHDGAWLDEHPVDLAARAGRRPVALPRLLRLRDVGLPAGEHHRDQADRSGPRTGKRRLGRQRHDRRGQPDHQAAEGDGRHQPPARRRRARHGLRQHRARRRVGGLRLQDLGRLLRAGSVRAAGDPRGAELRERGHRAAQGRPALRLGPRRRQRLLGGRRICRHRRHHSHRHRTVRHQEGLRPFLRQARLEQVGLPRRLLRQLPRGRLVQPGERRHRRPAARLQVLDRHLQFRSLEHHGRRSAQHLHLRRELPRQQVRPRDRPGRREEAGVGRLHPGRDPARRQGAVGDRRPLRRHRPDRPASSRRGRACSSRRTRTTPSASPTTRRSARRRRSTTTSTRRFSSALRRCCCRRRPTATSTWWKST